MLTQWLLRERSHIRDLSYSRFHRPESLARFLSQDAANACSMIDLDVCLFVEYADEGRRPLLLIETALDTGQEYKAATVTANLARLARIPAFCVLYTRAEDRRCIECQHPFPSDLIQFRVRQIAPVYDNTWSAPMPAAQYARWLADRRAFQEVRFTQSIHPWRP